MITVTFADGCLLATASKSLWQYDYDQQLEIVGLDLPEVFQVDFCNSGDTSTITVLGENNVVQIPEQFTSDGRNINAFCFVYDEATGGMTKAEMILSVLPRPQRTDEQPDPEQEHVIDQLITMLGEDAEDAEAWAVGERDGEPVSEGDPTYHNNAKYWAEKAQSDAPVTSVNGETGDVELDLDDIPNGSTYARATPAQLAQIATNTADIADVKETADTALQPAALAPYRTAADQDTIDNAQAVDIAAINDKIPSTASKNNKLVAWSTFNGQLGTKQAKITANGILKGDGAGGVSSATAGTDYATPQQVNEKYTKPSDGIPSTDMTPAVQASLQKADTALQEVPDTYRTAAAQDTIDAGKQTKITASGILKGNGSGGVSSAVAGTDYATPQQVDAKYTKPADGIPSTDMTAAVQASLSKADTALQAVPDTYRTAAAQDTIDNGKQSKIIVSGILKGDGDGGVSAAVAGTDYLAPSALDTYRTSAAQDVIDAAQNERLDAVEQTTTATTIGPVAIASFEASAANMLLKGLTVNIEPVQAGSGNPSPDNVRPITGWTGCNIVQSPTLNAQDGTTYHITFPTEAGTVYGGTLDVVNKKLTVDKVEHIFTGTETFKTDVVNGIGYITNPIGAHNGSGGSTSIPSLMCSHLSPSLSYLYDNRTNRAWPWYNSSKVYVMFGFPTGVTSAEEYQSYLQQQYAAGTPVTICYPLATPIIYDLTADEITTLLGENNIWADTGDVTVTYGAYIETVKAYADQVGDNILSAIAPLETSYTASRAYTVGSYLFVGTKFYKVTSAIAEGGTITLGTNVTQTTVAEQLMSNSFVILEQPHDVEASIGVDGTFSVIARGAAGYVWQYWTPNSQTWRDSSTTTSDYTLEVTEARYAYRYRCKVTGLDGSVIYSQPVKYVRPS